jgi:hypothetical protein
VRSLRVLLAVAVAVSVVHYADNFFNYADYPQPTSGPAPSQGVVGASWFVFTAFAAAGYWLYRDGRRRAAALCLAVYSGSGLVGFGHYTVDGATSMPWWRQAHIVADILCGIAVLAFAFAATRAEGRRWAAPNPTP